MHDSALHFVSKYPLIEYLDCDDTPYANALRHDARYWNTYCLWSDRLAVRHLQSPVDFDIPRQYRSVLMTAAAQSCDAANDFWQLLPSPTVTVASNLLKSA